MAFIANSTLGTASLPTFAPMKPLVSTNRSWRGVEREYKAELLSWRFCGPPRQPKPLPVFRVEKLMVDDQGSGEPTDWIGSLWPAVHCFDRIVFVEMGCQGAAPRKLGHGDAANRNMTRNSDRQPNRPIGLKITSRYIGLSRW